MANYEIKTITKRDGRTVPFTIEKIEAAVKKASVATGDKIDWPTITYISNIVVAGLIKNGFYIPTVEQVQDEVERVLMDEGFDETAKAYILYRAERTRSRNMKDTLMLKFKELTFADAKECDSKRENANINGDTPMGIMLKYGSTAAKEFDKLYVLEDEAAKAHEEGFIHIHDMDFYSTGTTTCCQIDLNKLFKNGFNTGHGFLRQPKSIQSYSALACIAIQSNQNDQHGGQAIPSFDRMLAPGVKESFRKRIRDNAIAAIMANMDCDYQSAKTAIDNIMSSVETDIAIELNNKDMLIEKINFAIENWFGQRFLNDAKMIVNKAINDVDADTYQAMESLIHNLNTMHSRAGAQVPFSSINYGTDTTPEGRMIIKNVLLAEEAGLGNGETPIFPIHIFKVKDGINFNEGDPNYDLFKLACRVSAKRLFPNFSFIDAHFNLQYYNPENPDTEISYMGCRTRTIGNVYDPTREIVTSRGNLSFTSINLPRLGIMANGNIDRFFESLDNVIDICVRQLLHRLKLQSSRKVLNFPFLMGQGIWLDSDQLKPDDTLEEVLKHGSLSLGFIGLAECLVALTGKHHGESDEAQELGLKIIKHMRKRMDEESKNRGLNFALIATPAEGLAGRFVRIDAKKFGVIEGVTDKEYYTNSFHVPVYCKITAFEKIKKEAPYHALTNGGHISYIELDGDPSKNVIAFEKIIRAMKENGIGYGAINHPVDRDPYCGFNGIIDDECPCCHRRENYTPDGEYNGVGFDRIRRITGYLVGTLDRFNDAKTAEVKDRVKHY